MRTLYKLIIFAIAMLAYGGVMAQTVIGNGNTSTITYQKGGTGADSMVKIPYRDTTALYPGYTKCGRITVRPQDGRLYVHDCSRWVLVAGVVPDSFASKRYVDSIVATVIAGTVDSNLYVTVTRLGDSLVRLDTVYNWITNSYPFTPPNVVKYPSNWTWKPFIFNRSKTGTYTINRSIFDVLNAYVDTMSAYFIDGVSGNDANDCLTIGTACRTWTYLINTKKARKIYTNTAVFYRNNTFGVVNDSSASPLYVGSLHPNGTYITSAENPPALTWSLVTGALYSCTRSAVQNVVDALTLDSFSKPSILLQVSTQDSCRDIAGTWFQSGSTLYLHNLDNRAPDANDWVNLQIENRYRTKGNVPFVFFDKMHFVGGTSGAFQVNELATASTSSMNTKAYFNECSFMYSGFSSGNGLTFLNLPDVWLRNCVAYENKNDGFNYHITGGFAPTRIFEENCVGIKNGRQQLGTVHISQASSAHDADTIIRMGGNYILSAGANIADVGNSYSFNIGVTAKKSISTANNFNFQADNCTMTIWDCFEDLSTTGLIETGTGSIDFIYTQKRSTWSGNINQIPQ